MNPKVLKLWEIVEREEIEVVYLPLSTTPERLKGVYLRDEGMPVILLGRQHARSRA